MTSMLSTAARIYNPDDLPVADPIEDEARRWLSRAGILAETDAGRLFRYVCHLANGQPGYSDVLPRRALLVESGVGSSSGLTFALRRLRETGLANGNQARRGWIEIVLLASPPKSAQGYLPTMEPEAAIGMRVARENEPNVCSNHLNKPFVQMVGSNAPDPEAEKLQALLERKRSEAAQAVAAKDPGQTSGLSAASESETAQEVRRSKSKSLSETKDLDLDLAEKQAKLAQAQSKALKKSAHRAIRIDQVQLLVPGLFRPLARRMIDDIDAGVYDEQTLKDVIDRGLDLVRDGKVPDLWNYVEGSMRQCAAERKRPWPPKKSSKWKAAQR